jgi:hydrogenase maturation factor HypF (carbamoyltransferase family)
MNAIPRKAETHEKTIATNINICKAGNRSYEGNAAASTEDLLDLTGQNKQLPNEWHCQSLRHMPVNVAVEQPNTRVIGDETDNKITLNICKAGNRSYEGNAAASTEDLLDLTGQNKQLPW